MRHASDVFRRYFTKAERQEPPPRRAPLPATIVATSAELHESAGVDDAEYQITPLLILCRHATWVSFIRLR